MSTLFDLPDALVSSLLSDWLTIDNVASLGSAVCNSVLRRSFLLTARSPGTTLQVAQSCLPRKGMHAWLFLRGIAVSGFHTAPDFILNHTQRSEYLKQHGGALHWIYYDHYSGVDRENVRRSAMDVVQYCPNLTGFYGTDAVDAAVYISIAKCFPQLEEFQIIGAISSSAVLQIAEACKNLRGAYIDCSYATEECLIALVRNNRNLQSMHTYCALYKSGRFECELARNCPNITEFKNSYGAMSEMFLYTLLGGCRNLSYIDLDYCTLVSSNHALDLIVNRNLRTLALTETELTERQLEGLLRACPALTSLTVGGCYELNMAAGSLQVGTLCPLLEDVVIAGCGPFLSETMLIDIGEHCQNLRMLNINNNRAVTDSGVIAVIQSCTAPQHLEVCGLAELTDATLIALAQHCSQIRELQLLSCPQVTDAGVVAVMRSCPLLTTFSVGSCSRVSQQLQAEVKAKYAKRSRRTAC